MLKKLSSEDSFLKSQFLSELFQMVNDLKAVQGRGKLKESSFSCCHSSWGHTKKFINWQLSSLTSSKTISIAKLSFLTLGLFVLF